MFYAIMLCKDISFNQAFFWPHIGNCMATTFFTDSCYPCRQWNLEGNLQENTFFIMFLSKFFEFSISVVSICTG